MNFALAGAGWDLVQCSYEFAIKHSKIKRMLVGIHPGELPLIDCEKHFPDFGKAHISDLLFSIRATDASIGTITSQKKNKPSHTKEGMYYYGRGNANMDNEFRIFFSRRISLNPQCLKPAQDEIKSQIENISIDLKGLHKMIKLARDNDIELVLFAYPSHAYSLELAFQCGEFEPRWQALKQISKLVEDESNNTVKIWHFYTYNDVTAEPITSNPSKYWQDPEHFNFEVGDLMLDDMFSDSQKKPNFGHRILYSKIESTRKNFMEQRIDFLKSHKMFNHHMQKLL